ncbi:hypothetical protein [Bacteroides fragilis]|jgi:hypothetical protein|uniref:hypothetical protein n=1 Tax=Bacteroides fragilis TaxID=817 RepID=UPI00044AAD09|nr:hypothetical protein [Bacteroides fragilis]EYE45567.1 hypothetical protein M127_3246 [Bacteroides fragilis str. S6L5]EYE51353.1 hypothetical protein M131_3238 [Bacteroides fragilis str. S6R8]MBU9019727.1 hypothetical protein [Bacteroides fragilis]MBU9024661.1 hypothetical protein [Bacteroides fragilis]MBU9084656.1 hypothetical protein [Bacteroides fragilis]
MEVTVNVNIELGQQTMAFLTRGFMATSAKLLSTEKVEEVKPESPAKPEVPAKPAAPAATTKTQRPAASKPAAAAEKPAFSDLDDDAKLEAIKAEVTKHTKKGKSADIKFLLANFDAGRASELSTEQYDAFFDAITRYGAGEAATDIFPALD